MALSLDNMVMIISISIDPIDLLLIFFFLFSLYFLLRRAMAAFINVVDLLLFQKHPIKMVKNKNVDEKSSAVKETSIQYHTFGKPGPATQWRHQSCKIAPFSQNIKTQARPRLSTDKISSSCTHFDSKISLQQGLQDFEPVCDVTSQKS